MSLIFEIKVFFEDGTSTTIGSDETVLFQHFINNGMKEGRKACENFEKVF